MLRYPTRGTPSHYSMIGKKHLETVHPDWDIDFHYNNFSVAVARCTIFREAAQKEVDYLYMIDDDIIPTGNVDTLHLQNKPVIAGLCLCWQRGHFFWNAFDINFGKEVFHSILLEEPGIRQVYTVGCGIICISKEVLQDPNMRGAFQETKDEWGCVVAGGGEDITFGRKCNEHGHSVWLDSNVQGEHYRAIALGDTLRNFQEYRANPEFTTPEQFIMGLHTTPIKFAPKVEESPSSDLLSLIA